jgi:hypothetical protein
MLSKTTYAVQPYQVGQKDRKSLALVIPARLARECDIDPSTIFAIRRDSDSKRLILEMMKNYDEEKMVSAKSSRASRRQTPIMSVQ